MVLLRRSLVTALVPVWISSAQNSSANFTTPISNLSIAVAKFYTSPSNGSIGSVVSTALAPESSPTLSIDQNGFVDYVATVNGTSSILKNLSTTLLNLSTITTNWSTVFQTSRTAAASAIISSTNLVAIPSRLPNTRAHSTVSVTKLTNTPVHVISSNSLVLNGINTTTIRILVPTCAPGDEACPLYPFSPGIQYITYYVTGGRAIVFGDIDAGPESTLLSYRVDSNGNPVDRRAFSIFADDSSSTGSLKRGPGGYPWPGGEISYKYDSEETRADISGILQNAFQNWQSITPFLKFTEVPDSPGSLELGVLNIRKGTVVDPEGNRVNVCTSAIGYSPSSSKIHMFLTLDNGCDLHSVVHQIGHSIGLAHEHQRPDRDNHIKFVCSNLNGYAQFADPIGSPCHDLDPSICCSPTTCFMNACDLAIIQGLDSTDDYDLLSLMHYGRSAFGAPDFGDTLVGAGTGGLARRDDIDHPSSTDAKRICKIYSAVCADYCDVAVKQTDGTCRNGDKVSGNYCSSICQLMAKETTTTLSGYTSDSKPTKSSVPTVFTNSTVPILISTLSGETTSSPGFSITSTLVGTLSNVAGPKYLFPNMTLQAASSNAINQPASVLAPAAPKNGTILIATFTSTISSTGWLIMTYVAALSSSSGLVTDTVVIPFEPTPSVSHITITVQATITGTPTASSSGNSQTIKVTTSQAPPADLSWRHVIWGVGAVVLIREFVS